jgi:putative phosphoribosyl transferase
MIRSPFRIDVEAKKRDFAGKAERETNMTGDGKGRIFELQQLRNRVEVFRDRSAAGKVLSTMLETYRKSDAIVLAVPAGGAEVAAVIARELLLPLDVAVVSKITPSWNTEVGYGAVAFDGTVMLNEDLLARFHLRDEEIEQGIAKTKEKVARRLKLLRGERPFPDLDRPVILVDDGLASGFTLHVAIQALKKARAGQIILAVPTAHEESLGRVIGEVESAYCPNIRGGSSYAVADVYEYWTDVEEKEVVMLLKEFNSR